MNLLPSDPIELRGSISELWRGRWEYITFKTSATGRQVPQSLICSVRPEPTWSVNTQTKLSYKMLPPYSVPNLFLFVFKCFYISEISCMYKMAFSISLWYQGFTQTKNIITIRNNCMRRHWKFSLIIIFSDSQILCLWCNDLLKLNWRKSIKKPWHMFWEIK